MPDPANYDSEDAWMADCVPTMVDEGTEQDHAVAACLNMWRERSAGEMATRAYSLLEVKAVDAEQRTIEGIASTPAVDRIGDIVEPLGAQFSIPMPLLWQHHHDEPVGHVTAAKASKDGIRITAKFARIDEPGELKNLVDKAWQAVKTKLVGGLSIGFKAVDFEPLDPKDPWGGLRFTKWNWYELSLVTIPANHEATISLVKSADEAALRRSETPRPGASGNPVVTLNREERSMSTKTNAERIREFEATRQAKAARMAEIMEKSGEAGETLDAEQTEEYDGLKAEVKSIDDHLVRMRDLEAINAAAAKPLTEIKTIEAGSAARGVATVRVKGPDLPPGIRFARVVKCLGVAQGNRGEAVQVAEAMYGEDQGIVNVLKAAARFGSVSDSVIKAAVAAGTTTNATWASPLVSDEGGVFADFVEFLRPMMILGKFGVDGIPSLRRVPFRTALISQTSGGAGHWVGESRPKPLTKFDLSRTTLTPLKVANIAVVTDELLRDSSPSADMVVRDGLAAALRDRMDTDFIDPTKAAVTGISPASITNAATPVASGGSTADDVREDVRKVFAAFVASNNPPETGVWIMPTTTALALSLMVNALGEQEFEGITMRGGTFGGLPVITSQYVPSVGSPVSAYVILANASDIYFADEGGIAVDMSREASLEMADDPANTGGGFGSPDNPVGASLVSLWQANLVGFRAERTLNWALRRDSGVQVLSGVAWGTPG